MTQEDKQLLLKDLCARLPYGVMCDIYSWQHDDPRTLIECVPAYRGEEIVLSNLAGRHSISEVKPYLRPMSSMTEEEKKSYHIIKDRLCEACIHGTIKDIAYWTNSLDLWFYKYHFDNANLIDKGLALEAPEDMYKTE